MNSEFSLSTCKVLNLVLKIHDLIVINKLIFINKNIYFNQESFNYSD